MMRLLYNVIGGKSALAFRMMGDKLYKLLLTAELWELYLHFLKGVSKKKKKSMNLKFKKLNTQ